MTNPAAEVISPERALWDLWRIQTHRVALEGSKMIAGILSISSGQALSVEPWG